jgi:hypothetical protein
MSRLTPRVLPFYISLLILLVIIPTSCRSERIPLFDDDGNEIAQLRMVQERSGELRISFPRNSTLRSGQYLSATLAQPGFDLGILLRGRPSEGDDEEQIVSEHRISAPIGIDRNQGALQPVIRIRRDMLADELIVSAPDEESAALLAENGIISLELHERSPGLILDDFLIVLPENLRYRQEVRNPAGNNGSDSSAGLAVYQDVYFDNVLDDFDYLNYIPVIEVKYEYAAPDEGMPVSISEAYLRGDRTYPDPAPPVARIDLLPDSLDLDESQSLELRLRPGLQSVYLYPEMFLGDMDLLRFSHDSVQGRMRGIEIHAVPRKPAPGADGDPAALEPLPIDMGQLMDYSQALWRDGDFEIFSWNLYPQVLMFDFADWDTQSRYLRRLAFYVEKDGYRGELLTNEELGNRHGWRAHNYHPRDLSRFFNQAEEEDFPLNPEEEELLRLLLHNGLLLRGSNGYVEGEGQIISVTSHPIQTTATRALFLNHEGLHGMFYNEPEMRGLSTRLWDEMPADVREFLVYYFVYMGYDPADTYLMINEFQAYMLQQDVVNLRWYVGQRMADRINGRFPELASFINPRREQAGWVALESGEALQSFIYQNRGLVAGDLFCLIDWPDEES